MFVNWIEVALISFFYICDKTIEPLWFGTLTSLGRSLLGTIRWNVSSWVKLFCRCPIIHTVVWCKYKQGSEEFLVAFSYSCKLKLAYLWCINYLLLKKIKRILQLFTRARLPKKPSKHFVLIENLLKFSIWVIKLSKTHSMGSQKLAFLAFCEESLYNIGWHCTFYFKIEISYRVATVQSVTKSTAFGTGRLETDPESSSATWLGTRFWEGWASAFLSIKWGHLPILGFLWGLNYYF